MALIPFGDLMMSDTLKRWLMRAGIMVAVLVVLLGAMILLSLLDPAYNAASPESATVQQAGADVVRDEIVPLASPVEPGRWAVVNLLVSSLALALGVWTVAGVFIARRTAARTGESRPQAGTPWVVAIALLGIALPLLFLFTQDPAGIMLLTDSMTLGICALTTLQVLLILLMRRARYDELERTEKTDVINGG